MQYSIIGLTITSFLVIRLKLAPSRLVPRLGLSAD